MAVCVCSFFFFFVSHLYFPTAWIFQPSDDCSFPHINSFCVQAYFTQSAYLSHNQNYPLGWLCLFFPRYSQYFLFFLFLFFFLLFRCMSIFRGPLFFALLMSMGVHDSYKLKCCFPFAVTAFFSLLLTQIQLLWCAI